MFRFIILSSILLSSLITTCGVFAKTLDPVPGQKIDHKGLVINPTPQKITLTEGTVDLSTGFKPVGEIQQIITSVPELKCSEDGVKIEAVLENNDDATTNNHKANDIHSKSGTYTMTIDGDGVMITAFDERGVFYALQTLRQILSGGLELSEIPAMVIRDYPTLNDRGVVEGFYGNPWSHERRLSLIDFFGENKLNVYIYGPKDDPYHNCPDWRVPYPDKEAAQIKELVDACERNYVDFVWAIHPGQDYRWNEEDYDLLIAKFQSMYDLGVRRFALFFDDINGEGTNPHLQTKLLNRITEEFVNTHPGVYPLAICPTDYSMIWANPTEDGALAIYGRELLPEISVMWTGEVVCGDLTPWAIQFINTRTKRPAYLWWNFPVQDYCREKILQGPVYGLYRNVTPQNLTAFVSNPMEHGEASKLALYSVADYTWNPLAYNALDSWERGIVEVEPAAAEAYRRFAIHSCDTESGYRRDESWETTTFTLDQWSDSLADALQEEFVQIENTPSLLRTNAADKALVAELNPWLDELSALGTRGRKVIDLARQYRGLPEQLSASEAERFWQGYTALCMTDEQKAAYNRHKVGTYKLQPFYFQMMQDMGKGFNEKLVQSLITDNSKSNTTSESVMDDKGRKAKNLNAEDKEAAHLMFDRDSSTSYKLSDKVEFGLPVGTDKIMVLSGQKPKITLIEVDAQGKTLKKSTLKKQMTQIRLQPSTTGVILSGKGEIFEILQ